MCTVLLPPGDNPIAVNKYIISHQNTVKRTQLNILSYSYIACLFRCTFYYVFSLGVGVFVWYVHLYYIYVITFAVDFCEQFSTSLLFRSRFALQRNSYVSGNGKHCHQLYFQSLVKISKNYLSYVCRRSVCSCCTSASLLRATYFFQILRIKNKYYLR